MFRTQFGGARPRQAQPGGQPQQSNPLQQFLHIIPVVILLLFTFFSSPSDPVGLAALSSTTCHWPCLFDIMSHSIVV